MADIRTAAQAVLDLKNDDYPSDGGEWSEKAINAYEALRQALDAPVEPVAWQYRVVFRLTGEDSFRHGRWHECRDKAEYDDYKSRHWYEVRDLYTTPPSVDALIAEIDGLHRYNFFNNGVLVFDEVEVEAILDKYRGGRND